MSRQSILMAVFGAALCVALAVLLHHYDLVRGPVERWSEAAGKDRFLALKRLAEKRGAKVEVQSRHGLPPAGQTLVMLGGRMDLSRVEHAALIDWIEAGGHLVTHPFDGDIERLGQDTDLLLDRLDVRVIRPSVVEEMKRSRSNAMVWTLQLPEGQIQVRPSIIPTWTLNHYSATPDWRASDADGDRIVRYALGAGTVTLSMPMAYLNNHWLDELDHGALAVVTMNLQPGTVVTILRQFRSGGLGAWLVTHALAFLIALALLVAVWTWRHSVRFGPILPSPVPRRQSLAEHIRASGRWLWRSGAHQALYAACLAAFRRRLTARMPGLAQLPRSERARRIAEHAGVPVDVAELALDPAAPADPRVFVQRIRTIESILARM